MNKDKTFDSSAGVDLSGPALPQEQPCGSSVGIPQRAEGMHGLDGVGSDASGMETEVD